MPVKKPKYIPPEQWGRDHRSLLLYLETICVDHSGVVGFENGRGFSHMRCDATRHPYRGGDPYRGEHQPGPTRLADGTKLQDHDDWDCLDDLEAAGLVENVGTGANPVVKLTAAGWTEAHRLRRTRAERALKKG